MTIDFDMDGTIANFYGVENWPPPMKLQSRLFIFLPLPVC